MPDPAVPPEAKGIWVDQTTRMKGDRFVCGECGVEWPTAALGAPFEHDRCRRCGGLLTAVWAVYPGQAIESAAVPPEAYEADNGPTREAIRSLTGAIEDHMVHRGQGLPAVRADDWWWTLWAPDRLAEVLAKVVWSLGVAEGRRQAAEAIRAEINALCDRWEADASGDVISITAVRYTIDRAARIAEGNTDA